MSQIPLRIALVGAGTLLGKAVNDALSVSAFASAEVHLLDDEETSGTVAAASDEVSLIQTVDAESFAHCDFAFFAGRRDLTRTHWRDALKSGSRVIDLTGELESVPGILVRAPWIQDDSAIKETTAAQKAASAGTDGVPDLQTGAVISAHPAVVLLALLAMRAEKVAPVRNLWATLLQPASEYGHAALEELHRQTTNLLSFQPLPMNVFGGQTAFSLAVSFGIEGQVPLANAAGTIQRDFKKIAPQAADALALQVVQAPVFHGYSASISLEFTRPVVPSDVHHALNGPFVRVLSNANEFPGSVQAVEEEEIQVLVRPVPAGTRAAGMHGFTPKSQQNMIDRFWLWAVADNLKLAARNAVACALELNRLRPHGTVQ